MTKTANKGEWSELYVLLKLLGEKKVYAGDGELNKIENLFYPVLKVLRDEQNIHYEYSLDDDIVIISEEGKELLRKSVSDFLYQANVLLDVIRKEKGTFAIPEIEQFMKEIHSNKIKAESKEKKDITIVIHDLRTGMTPTLGFSIKSQLGGNSTLFNAGKTTNFTFSIVGHTFTEAEIDAINAIDTSSKIRDRVKKINELGGTLCFKMMDDAICYNNFVLIDSCLPHIMANILVESNQANTKNLKEVTEQVATINPLNYDTTYNQQFYTHKVKNFYCCPVKLK